MRFRTHRQGPTRKWPVATVGADCMGRAMAKLNPGWMISGAKPGTICLWFFFEMNWGKDIGKSTFIDSEPGKKGSIRADFRMLHRSTVASNRKIRPPRRAFPVGNKGHGSYNIHFITGFVHLSHSTTQFVWVLPRFPILQRLNSVESSFLNSNSFKDPFPVIRSTWNLHQFSKKLRSMSYFQRFLQKSHLLSQFPMGFHHFLPQFPMLFPRGSPALPPLRRVAPVAPAPSWAPPASTMAATEAVVFRMLGAKELRPASCTDVFVSQPTNYWYPMIWYIYYIYNTT